MLLTAANRDPAAPRRLIGVLAAIAVLWPLLHAAQVAPGVLVAPGNLRVIGHFLAAFVPLETGHAFLLDLGRATLQTVAIATAGMTLAWLLGVPLAYLASRGGTEAVSSNRLTGPVRVLVTLLRGIPELVWALLFVRVFGLGPSAGVLALGLTYGGMLAKVYAEILESVDPRPARALAASGAGRLVAVAYGLLPQATKELVSYTVYRWECALRASVVMGFVGAGGLGQLMDQAMKMLNGGEAATILLAFTLLVLLADALSKGLRRALDAPAAHRAAGVGPVSLGLVAALAIGIGASVVFLDFGLGALFESEAVTAMRDFAAGFFPPDLERAWLLKVAHGAWETLAISAVGTLLAAVAALALVLVRPAPLFGLGFNVLRSVPELVWATITVLAAGLGPFAGVLALALHTTGVLGRLYAETLQNAPPLPRDALVRGGASGVLAFLYGTLPVVAPQLLAYTLYRWEMNIRMAAILGFVGAGGLGQLLYVELSLFHHAQASTVIAAMLGLSIAVDWASGRLRRLMR